MTWPNQKTSSGGLDALVDLGRKQGESYTRAELDAGLARVSKRLEGWRTRQKRIKRIVPVVLLLLGSTTLFVTRPWSQKELPRLEYALSGGVVLDGGYLREVNGSGVVVTFDEGTTFALAKGARGRLRSVTATGARLGLENGSAVFDVTPNLNHRWEVEVGPFLVQVKGTKFEIAWDPRLEQFRLDLSHGRVTVSGPVSGGELSLQAGQRLVVDLGRGETRISEAQLENRQPSSVASSQQVVASMTQAVPSVTPSTVDPRDTPAPKRDWARALAKGRWDEILNQAEQTGVATIHATASAEELFTLANAARYRHRTQLARESLLALQRRFAQSPRALDALFLLGRVDEARGDLSQARVSYDEYLARAPKGAFAAEALGRKLTLIARASGPEKARPFAEQYLRQFPNGSYAGSARAVLEAR